MKQIIKRLIILLAIFLAVAGIYLGSYLPVQKSKAFISLARSLSEIRTLAELQKRFDEVFYFYSPVGQPEVIGFLLEQIVNVLRQKQPEELYGFLKNYAVEIAGPVLNDSANPELTKIILKIGSIYQLGWMHYANEEYWREAEFYFKRGLEISPRRPQFLYGLLQLYLTKDEKAKAKEVAEEIIKYWPSDKSVSQARRQL